jgi:glycerol kinase
MLDTVPNARDRAEKGELLFGTVDTYLLWKLTQGRAHATDATNASRTLLYNIHTQEWDTELLAAFSVPSHLLPIVLDNTADFGMLDKDILGIEIPILSMAGDQQSATVGQACFEPGMIKATYGTGCFMLLNTGKTVLKSNNRLLSTIAYRINNQVTYGLEGSIFSAGITVKWLRDSLKMIASAAETEGLAKSIANTGGVYLVPAFTGLGAPYWDPDARGALLGLTLNSRREHIVRAALETIGYQTRDLLNAMHADYQSPLTKIRVDGGMVANNWLMQFVADMLRLEVHKPVCIETTALGVAYLAGLQAGLYQSLDDIAKHWQMKTVFHPEMKQHESEKLYDGWLRAIERVIN